ncbi:aminopeptidase [Intrasporangium oryzae NRRL B-24470]|uniref:Aminopeptidase n=1 Tax=Intrasporangium oryzae NRRL B-24470 TaxID=1386089 RepID=W9GDL3_9MICO|nr:aminopeptidase [Intrasporangium oryzae]EWT03307.1 aminopeptidase [Intrasporangium oryzae NRRL B-24470]
MTEPFDHLLEAYARLVIRIGVNVQPGQRVEIRGEPEQADTARALALEAYRVGASKVTITYVDRHLQRAEVEHAPDEWLGRSLPWEVEGIRAMKEDRPAVIALTGNPNPRLMDGLDPARLVRSTKLDQVREFLPLTSASEIAWTVVGAPTPGWAESILGVPDTARLWDAVATAMRLDEDDPVRSWREHLDALALRRNLLNERSFDRIRYRGPGTDLTIGVAAESRWVGGELTNAEGTTFVPNMPTEEVFLTPDWRRAEGRARTTAPFFLATSGTLVEGLEVELSDGTVTGARAERGEREIHEQFESIPRSRHLGEIAIVDGGSRVRRSGLVFNDMLYDENVGSHIAWGNGWNFGFAGSNDLTPDERVAAGQNQSATHVDIVIGSPDVEIDGIAADGTVTPLVQGDTFVLDGA